MTKKVVFEDFNGLPLRLFLWSGEKMTLVQLKDSRRLSLCANLKELIKKNVPFKIVKEVSQTELSQGAVPVGTLGRLKMTDAVSVLPETAEFVLKEDPKNLKRSFLGTFSIMLLSILILINLPKAEKTEEEKKKIKEYVVRIIKQKKVRVAPKFASLNRVKKEQKVKKPKKSVRRLGALKVLGSLKKRGQQVGGLNLGAVKTSAGPGLGGSRGSGGVQKSLYGKGLISAPVGAGQNLRGAGGYGTKGKGGGKAGYGHMALTGSNGIGTIPLAQDAIVGGGLDKSLITQVIAENMAQIRFCYEQGLQMDSKLAGRVAVQFVIGPNGSVKTAGIQHTTVNSKIVEGCIISRLKSWKFPVPEQGFDVKVSYPFMLKRAGSS